MSEGTTYDVIIVGAGLAGLTAARRSQQLGAKVLVIEKGDRETANATRRTGAALHACYLDPKTNPPDHLYRTIMGLTDGEARADVARAWADNAKRAVEWLTVEGTVFEHIGNVQTYWNRIGPKMVDEPLLDREVGWKGAGADQMLDRLESSFVRDGGTFRLETRAVELIVESGTVVGVVAEASGRRETLRGRAVILADGGYQANRDLMRTHVTKHRYVELCCQTATGDGLRMAMAVGAKPFQLDKAYQWIVLRDQLDHPVLGHPPLPTVLVRASIVVDGRGERVGDEAQDADAPLRPSGYSPNLLSDKRLAAKMSKDDAPGDFWIVFDEAMWQGPARWTLASGDKPPVDDGSPKTGSPAIQTPLNPTLLEHRGSLLTANTIEELASAAGLPAATLRATVDSFNRFANGGTPMTPPRSGRPRPIAQPPFHAIPIVPGIFFTMGGILVNGAAQVLDQQERPIAGLYAAGGTMGGLEGGPRNGYAGGLTKASTFGLLSAESAVASLRTTRAPALSA